MKELMTKIIEFIRRSNFLLSLTILFSIFLAYYISLTIIYHFARYQYDIAFTETPNESIMQESFLKQLLFVVIIGPLFETLIFKKWLYQLLSLFKILKRNKIWLILISVFIFGSIHIYSLSYIVFSFFAGIILMAAYVLRKGKNPYLFVATLHALMNLFVILMEPLEQKWFG